jgi:hypothetical protein
MRKTTVRHSQNILAWMLGFGVLLGGAGSVLAADVRDHRGEAPLKGPPGFTFCAREGEHCRFSGTVDVAYGGPLLNYGKVTSELRFVYKYGISTGGINCKDDNFPNPPDDKDQIKACYVKDVRDHRAPGSLGAAEKGGPPGFTKCAEHGQRCQFRGTADVAYGPPGGKFVFKDAVLNGVDCDSRGGFYHVEITGGSTSESYYVCYMRLRPETPTPTPPAPTRTPVWQQPNVRDHR